MAGDPGRGQPLVGVEAQLQGVGVRDVEAVAGEAALEGARVQPDECGGRGRRQTERVVPALVLRAGQRPFHVAHLQGGEGPQADQQCDDVAANGGIPRPV